MIRDTKIIISFAMVLFTASILGLASYLNTQQLIRNHEWVDHTHEVIENLENILSAFKDAETGQRGYILTGKDHYLAPYDHAAGLIETQLAKLTELTRDNTAQQSALLQLKKLASFKMAELRQTIELRRKSGLEAAMPVILSDRGQKIMDDIRELASQMQGREEKLLQSRQSETAAAIRWTEWTVVGGIPLSLLIFAIAAIALLRSGRSRALIAGSPTESPNWRKTAFQFLFAVIMVLLASLLRVWLQKLGPMPLFITFYPAVLLVAIVSGGGPGILATMLSGLVTLYYFIPPYGRLSVGSPADVLALAIFSGTNLSLCIVAERMRRSRWIEAFGLAKQQESEELAEKNEELAQQSEELSQQAEELAQQNEELQSQSEEIQILNAELTGREEMLRKLLEAARLHSTEESVLKEICAAALDIFGPSASAVVICERQQNVLSIRAHAGSSKTPEPWPIEGAFPGLVMQEGRTACLNDASLRPDLKLLQVADEEPFQSALSTPLHVSGELFGAVTIYSRQKQEWTTEHFRLVEWLDIQCGHILETLRLQDQLRQTAEQNRLLSDLLNRSDQPFGMGFPNGKLGYVNAAFERLTGYNQKELEEMDWATVLTPSRWRSLEQAKLEELSRTGQAVRYEKEYVRKDGTLVPIELLVHLIKDDRGLPLQYYSFITEISDRKLAEATLAKAKDELEQRVVERTVELAQRAAQLRALAGELTLSEQRERSRLAKILHDHLQQLLVASKFRLAILGKGAEDLMKKGLREVEELIDESITSSRSLTAELSPPILHEAGLGAGLEWLARRMSDKHGLWVEQELEEIPPLPEDLKIMLFESVREFLFNVVKHARTHTATISLSRVGGFLQLMVSDEGAGFDPSALPRAGEAGRGFGLFSVRERLELFGGKLVVQSSPNQGTRICIYMPMPDDQANAAPPAALLAMVPEITVSRRDQPQVPDKKIRILLADDHVVVRQGMAAMLNDEADFEVVGGAANGQEAVELARKLLPKVILMDMSMPILNGIEATRIISRENPDIRIIGLSMFDDSERADAMQDAGAVYYLTKSGPAEELINAIRRIVVRSS